ncbi:MAG: hypothetical protein JWL90_3044 [Chthoniobacteraceae bacterium]|nr:hypothetical protein [Chthoniobacteraceae bacterium]
MRFKLLALAASLLGSQLLAEETPTPDDQARFLAGLPVTGTPLQPIARSAAWTEHAARLESAWQKLENRQLTPIGAWSTHYLSATAARHAPLFYMFSGPDFLYAHAFFPSASTYVLCGIEPVGSLPDITQLPREALEPSLQRLGQALGSILSFSFFITKEMKVHLEETRLSGTLPVLYVFLARSGCHIDDVRLVGLDKDGTLIEGKGPTSGVKIVFTSPGGQPAQTLYYFSSDLSDGPADKTGFLKWCDSLGEGDGFLKAASYLMHGGNFNTVRKFLLSHSKVIVQDESGVPIKYFAPADWRLRFFGSYPGPIEIFKQHTQPLLKELYRQSNPPPLTFSFGYRWHPSESTLILAEKK